MTCQFFGCSALRIHTANTVPGMYCTCFFYHYFLNKKRQFPSSKPRGSGVYLGRLQRLKIIRAAVRVMLSGEVEPCGLYTCSSPPPAQLILLLLLVFALIRDGPVRFVLDPFNEDIVNSMLPDSRGNSRDKKCCE